MDELLSLLPDLQGVLSVPVIMLAAAISVSVIVVALRALIRLVVKLVHRITREDSVK